MKKNEEMRKYFPFVVMYNIKGDNFYMSLCPCANVLIQFLRIYRLSSKYDKGLLLV